MLAVIIWLTQKPMGLVASLSISTVDRTGLRPGYKARLCIAIQSMSGMHARTIGNNGGGLPTESQLVRSPSRIDSYPARMRKGYSNRFARLSFSSLSLSARKSPLWEI